VSARVRLARLEESLAPGAAVVVWLADARRYRSVAAYAATLVDERAQSMPLERILERAERATMTAHRGSSKARVEAARAAAVEEAITAFEIVLVLNLEASASIRRTRRVLDALAANGDSGLAAAAAVLVDDLREEMQIEDDARGALERRYLDGHAALFDDTHREWRSLARAVEGRASRAGKTSSSTGDPQASADPSVTTSRARPRGTAEERASAIEVVARLRALELLGAHDRADSLVHARARSRPDGLPTALQVRGLERLTRRSASSSRLPMRDHPVDHLTLREQAEGYRRLAERLEALDVESERSFNLTSPENSVR
jgi:hypothetical protein